MFFCCLFTNIHIVKWIPLNFGTLNLLFQKKRSISDGCIFLAMELWRLVLLWLPWLVTGAQVPSDQREIS